MRSIVDCYFGIIGQIDSKWVDEEYGNEIRWLSANGDSRQMGLEFS